MDNIKSMKPEILNLHFYQMFSHQKSRTINPLHVKDLRFIMENLATQVHQLILILLLTQGLAQFKLFLDVNLNEQTH